MVNTSAPSGRFSGNTATSWSAARGGIYLYGYGVTIQGNLIGLDASGSGLLGNGGGIGNTAGIVGGVCAALVIATVWLALPLGVMRRLSK